MDSYIVCRYLKASVINMQMHHEKKKLQKNKMSPLRKENETINYIFRESSQLASNSTGLQSGSDYELLRLLG